MHIEHRLYSLALAVDALLVLALPVKITVIVVHFSSKTKTGSGAIAKRAAFGVTVFVNLALLSTLLKVRALIAGAAATQTLEIEVTVIVRLLLPVVADTTWHTLGLRAAESGHITVIVLGAGTADVGIQIYEPMLTIQ